jgi:two-component system, LuxR family, response regulator FixJ
MQRGRRPTSSKAAILDPHAQPTSDLFVVDDGAIFRGALLKGFTLAGYRVAGFADTEMFLAAVRGRALACILLDLHLPDKSGVTVF